MSDDGSRERRVARREREIEALARQFHLTLAEYVLLHLVHYEDRPMEHIVGYARGLWEACGYPLQPREEYDRALASLLERRLLQRIDEPALVSIRALLDADPAIGPTEGLPEIGTIQFTLEGLELWRQLRHAHDVQTLGCGVTAPVYGHELDEVPRPGIQNHCTIYCQCLCHGIRFAKDLNASRIAVPVPIGPWRCRWWDKYPSGFRVECEYDPENV